MSLLVTAWMAFVTILHAQPSQSAAPDPAARARAVLAAIAAKEFAKVEEQFDDKMKGALPPGRLEAFWTTLQGQAGAFKACDTESRVRTIADKQMVITTCEFERAKVDAQIAFDQGGRISGLAFRPAAPPAVDYTPPPYATPSAYTESDLTVGSGDWALPGTLDMPAGAGPFPAVVLVHGSGPNDRDETVGANKPFKDLAAGLASRGVAVLRYDKRTKAHSEKAAALTNLTVKEEVVDDAIEAVKALRSQPKIDPARVFVLGHSLGGMLIPRIGAADPKIAGLVVMAGAARPLEDAILAQTRYLTMVDGTISPEEQKAIDDAAALVASVRALTPEDAKAGKAIFGAPASYWLDLRGYDPPSAAKDVKAPMLILQGERDYQVTMDEFAKWKAALGSRRDVTFHSYPALNHLFIAGTGPGTPAEYQVPGHAAEEVIRDISTWILHPAGG
jgi:uncharacterized protein